jgi:hypothetical protein
MRSRRSSFAAESSRAARVATRPAPVLPLESTDMVRIDSDAALIPAR